VSFTNTWQSLFPRREDARWFFWHMFSLHPHRHSTLRLTKVNTYALAYHWEGSDGSLKPILLAGHQDVVPVDPDTISAWPYPPYSGHYDGIYCLFSYGIVSVIDRSILPGTFIWGRGSADDKSGLIGILLVKRPNLA
jgi:Gly-Xaa carboxypeptidase